MKICEGENEGGWTRSERFDWRKLQEHAAHLNLIKHSYWDRFCSLIGRSMLSDN